LIVRTGADNLAVMNDNDTVTPIGDVTQGDFTAGVVTGVEALDSDENGVLCVLVWLERWKTLVLHGLFRLLVEVRNLGE
jgi:hypothetical protein